MDDIGSSQQSWLLARRVEYEEVGIFNLISVRFIIKFSKRHLIYFEVLNYERLLLYMLLL